MLGGRCRKLLCDLVATQDIIFTLLLESRQTPTRSRQLYFLAGVVGGLLTNAGHELARPHVALTQARTAFICAEQADHNGLRAWIRVLQSMVCYWAGRPYEALRFAQSGARFAATSTGTTAVRLPMSEARASARLGNAPETIAAIERAERARERVTLDDLDAFIGGFCTFGRPWQLYYAADALVWFPDEARKAERYASDAVQVYEDVSSPDWSFACQAMAHIDLGTARAAHGDLDGAVVAITPALDLPVNQRISGIVHAMHRISDTIRPHRGPTARGLHEQIEAFAHTPLRLTPH